MKKRNAIAGIIILIMLFVGASVSQLACPSEPPEICITAAGQELYYTVGKNEWNGKKYDRIDVLVEILTSSLGSAVSYVPEGETVEIEFLGKAPDSYELTKEWAANQGESRVEVPINFQNKKGSFIHSEPDLAEGDDITLIGYRLICRWGKNECEYGFMISNIK